MNYPKNRYTGEKPWMDKDWLYEEYVVKDRRTKDIAEEYGCKQNTIQQWLLKHKISKPITKHVRKKKQHELYEYLYHNHVELGKSVSQIAKENKVSYDAIHNNLKKNGIQIIKQNRHYKFTDDEIQKIIELYCDEGLSAYKIGLLFNTDNGTIRRYLTKSGIKTRGMSEAQFNYNGKEIHPDLLNIDKMNDLHWNQHLTCKAIGDMYGIDAGTVRRQMHRLGLETMNNSESKIGLMTGENHPNWQGGITPLYLLLREYFTVNQVPKIAKRDNYTCQLCGATHTILHIHHIKHFSDIIKEIIKEHPEHDINTIDERIALYKIIVQDSRFLDDNNLITYCKDCHLFKIHNYKRHKTISSQASNEEGSTTIPQGSTP